MKKKVIPFLITVAVLAQANSVFAAENITAFTDYNKDLGYGQLSEHWAKSDIETLLSHNGISGYPEGDFRADKEISSAELIAMLLNAAGRVDNLTGDTWSEQIMNKAYELKTLYGRGYTTVRGRCTYQPRKNGTRSCEQCVKLFR